MGEENQDAAPKKTAAPIIPPTDDEFTPTGSLGIEIPEEIERPKGPPIIYQAELEARETPATINDPDATAVQPKVAYPGETKLPKPIPVDIRCPNTALSADQDRKQRH